MSTGCNVFAVCFQIYAAIIWVSTVIFVIYFIHGTCKTSTTAETCYERFYNFIKYIFIIVSIPITIEDTITMRKECLAFNDDAPYGSGIADGLSNFFNMIQMGLILSMSFMKAHWAFSGTDYAISQKQLTIIFISNIAFWSFFAGALVIIFVIPDLNVNISYSLFILIAFIYFGMTIWAQLIFNKKLETLNEIKMSKINKNKAMIQLIIKHKLMIRFTLWCTLFNATVGAIYLIGDIKWMWYIWHIIIVFNKFTNLVCILLTYKVVDNVYTVIYGSCLCNQCCKAFCLCSCFDCAASGDNDAKEKDIANQLELTVTQNRKTNVYYE